MRGIINWPLLAIQVIVTVGLCPPLAAGQEQGDKTFDKNLDSGLRDVINRGAAIYNNQGDFAGCYRLFEGALITIKPLLGTYPELQKKIDSGLGSASMLPNMHERAHSLRKVLDEVRHTVNPIAKGIPKDIAEPEKKALEAKKESTLWDRLGGETAVNKVLSDLFTSAADDPKVDFSRGGKYPLTPDNVKILHKSVLDFISSATGGPFKYTGPTMKEAHKGMGITNDQFNAFAKHLRIALEQNGVAPPDVAALLAAVEGTRQAIVEQPDKK
jgi:hemoglobin